MNEQEEFEFRLRLENETAQPSTLSSIKQGAGNLAAGALRGAGSIGATILAPYDIARDAINGKGLSLESNRQRRAGIDGGLEAMGAEPGSMLYKAGKLGGEIAGTAGVGGVLANGLRALPVAGPGVDALATALQTGGFRTGASLPAVQNLATRIGAGAAVGGASAGMVNPEDAGLGAVIGGALPAGAQLAGKAGSMLRKGLSGGGVSDEVRNLATRAQELGINIPADRLVNSRPLNALTAGLNYVPFSGRAATEDAMNSQLNQALSKTFGQDSSNVTQALRKAQSVLGGQFDAVLKSNVVRVDEQFMADLAESANKASRELGSDGASIIGKQVDDILAKAATGEIDGQAAYNIKKTLDRIGGRTTPEAFYANDLKKALMGALNRSLGPDQAAAFATTRQQYGTMLDLQKLAKNGAEGEISAARLSNMKNIGNGQVQELADIAAQFVKPREGAHGGAQRALVGALGFGAGGLPALAGGAAIGRGANMALNSQTAKNFLLGGGGLLGEPEALGLLTRGAYRAAPLLPSQ